MPRSLAYVQRLLGPCYTLLTNNKTEMCTILLDQFNSVISTPKPDMIISDPVSFFSCQSIPIGAELNYLSDIEFSESIIVESIKELSSNSAAGPDGFSFSLLINCSDILAPALNVMFSQSLTQGVFPSALKRAVIVPIFRSGDKSIPANYRPISLTSCISKVFERIIRKQVLAFLERKGLLNNTQHGFRSGRSCLSALLNVFDNLMNMIDSSTTVDMIYLDFSEAFDKVDHGIVLHKLRDLGITGNLGVWFHQFLSDRTQFVRLPSGVSKDSPVLSGVPQGTVLGPLLFIIMISDINKDILSSKIISFADDTRVYKYTNITQIENSDSLQTDLNYIYLWAINNNMLFNHQKFNYISFSTSMSSINTNVYYSPSLDIIKPSENVLDLGITMSRNCSFDVHINILCKKCTDLSGWILRTFTSRDSTTLMTLFNA